MVSKSRLVSNTWTKRENSVTKGRSFFGKLSIFDQFDFCLFCTCTFSVLRTPLKWWILRLSVKLNGYSPLSEQIYNELCYLSVAHPQGVCYGLRLEDGRPVPLPDKHQSGPCHSSRTTSRCNDLIPWDARWVWRPDVCRYPFGLQLSSPKPAHEDSPALEGTCTKPNLIPPNKSGC